MNVLIAKLGATGDVVRTTALLRALKGEVTWITAAKNACLLQNLPAQLRVLTWEDRHQARDRDYDLVINLEDEVGVGEFLKTVKAERLFGAHLDEGVLIYTKNSRQWFDLSLISRFGRQTADKLKLQNRHTYQELIFDGLGIAFTGERYLLPLTPMGTDLKGDVAIAAESGPVWPMKKWAYYSELKEALEQSGFTVNVLPQRSSLLEHLSDVRNHRCLVGGDTLPMHLALGSGIQCVSIFNCTSPWEIHDYGLQTKVVSPLLDQFFYKRGFDPEATKAVRFEEVLAAVLDRLKKAPGVVQ